MYYPSRRRLVHVKICEDLLNLAGVTFYSDALDKEQRPGHPTQPCLEMHCTYYETDLFLLI